ncbi:MAG: EamA family transporter, partial [Actinobacteria bacterium]|nr:EamA family transporter [Actinomycetota bacterium]
MLGVAFAVLSALGFGAGQFLTQLGLRGGRLTALQALFINLAAACGGLVAALAVVSAAFAPPPFSLRGVAVFVIAGLMAPLLGRSINFLAIERIGATRTASLGMSESLFAAVIAYLVLGQAVSYVTAPGMLILVGGSILFINETSRAFGRTGTGARGSRPAPPGRAWTGAVLALTSGFFFAAAGVLRQVGMNLLPSALLGATIGTLVAFAVTTLHVIRRRQAGGLRL